jgi:hypothetical protein
MPYLRLLVATFSPLMPRFNLRSGHVGCDDDIIAVVQVFFEYFGFPCQFSFYQLLYIH